MSSVPIHVWSVDDGYGDSKLFNGKDSFIIPSFVTEKPDDFNENLLGKDIDPLEYIVTEYNGKEYLVGRGVIRHVTSPVWNGAGNKHKDVNFPVLLATCLALMAKEEMCVVEPLVMGLPVKADQDQKRKDQLKAIVEGTHQVKVTLGNGQVLNRIIVINELVIKKQPLGSLFNLILDDNGQIVEEDDITADFNVVVDIGARTVNVYTLNDLDPVNGLCDNNNKGMFTAFERVAKYVHRKTGQTVPTGKYFNFPLDKAVGDLDITDELESQYRLLASEVFNYIESMFVDSWADVQRIIFTGGGSELLREYLEELFEDRPAIFLGRFDTAKGLRKWGVRQAIANGKTVATPFDSKARTSRKLAEVSGE